MTDPTPDTGTDARLARALAAATEDLPRRDRVTPAVEGAARVRRRRRLVGGVAAVAAVVAAVALPAFVGGPDRVDPAPSPTSPTVSDPDVGDPTPPTDAEGDGKLGPYTIWDPRALADVPVESNLPRDLAAPAQAPGLFDARTKALLLASPVKGRDLMVLSADGTWRSVPGTAESAGTWSDGTPHLLRPALTADGTRLAFATVEGARVVDVRDNSSIVLPWPRGTYPWDTPPALHWTDGGTALVVDDWDRAWKLALDGTLTEPRWARHSRGEMVAEPDGTLWQYDWKQRELWRWTDVGIEHKIVEPIGWGQGWAARGDRVVANGNIAVNDPDSGRSVFGGPVVLDATDGTPLAWAPIRDKNGVYTDNGRLQIRGFTAEGTLLMVVRVESFDDRTGEADTYLVEWAYEQDEFRVLGKSTALGLDEDGLLGGAVAVDALAEVAR